MRYTAAWYKYISLSTARLRARPSHRAPFHVHNGRSVCTKLTRHVIFSLSSPWGDLVRITLDIRSEGFCGVDKAPSHETAPPDIPFGVDMVGASREGGVSGRAHGVEEASIGVGAAAKTHVGRATRALQPDTGKPLVEVAPDTAKMVSVCVRYDEHEEVGGTSPDGPFCGSARRLWPFVSASVLCPFAQLQDFIRVVSTSLDSPTLLCGRPVSAAILDGRLTLRS